jgi:antitoxin FitA
MALTAMLSMTTLVELTLNGANMAVLTIRNIDDVTKAELRLQAARHGRSMEEEARRILAGALKDTGEKTASVAFGTSLRQHFAGLGDLTIPPRQLSRPAPDLALDSAQKLKKKTVIPVKGAATPRTKRK